MPNPMVAVGAAGVGASVYGSRQAKKGADAATAAQVQGAGLAIDEQRLAREALEQRLQPFTDLGSTASPYLQQLMGLPTEQSQRLQELIGDDSASGWGTTGSVRHTERLVNAYRDRLENGNPDSQLRLTLQDKLGELERKLASDQLELDRLQRDPLAQSINGQMPGLPQSLDASQLPGSLDPSQLPAQATALDRSRLPGQGQALDRSQLPSAGTAFGPDSFKNNPMLDFVMKEGFRDIREGAAGRGRVPDRDLVEFAQGTASTLLPALQAQQFGQQQALRGQAVGEQARQFGQQQALRGQAVGEQSQQFGQQTSLRGQALSDMLGLRNQALGEQAQQFGQLGGLRESAVGEQQRSINNLMGLLGMGQSAAAGQGAAGLSTGSNISNLLGNIGTAQAAGALQRGQAGQDLAGNVAGLAGLLGGGLMSRPYQPYTRPTSNPVQGWA